MSGGAPADPITVAVIEDQRRTRELLAALLDADPGCAVVGMFAAMEPALDALTKQPADVVLTDIGLPGMSGIEGIRRLRSISASMQILMLTVYDDNDHVFEAICAGASGYLLKDTPPDRLLAAVREVHDGGAPMTPEIARKVVGMFQRIPPRGDEAAARLSARELDVLKVLSEGHSYKTAAAALDMSPDTVRFHVRHIYSKLHVHSKSEAVLKAFRTGLLT